MQKNDEMGKKSLEVLTFLQKRTIVMMPNKIVYRAEKIMCFFLCLCKAVCRKNIPR